MNGGGGYPPLRFEACPTCTAPLRDHSYIDRAQADQGDAHESVLDRAPEGFGLVYPAATLGAHRVLRVLRCPDGRGAVVPLALAPTALEDDVITGLIICVGPTQMKALSDGLSEAWHPYAHTWLNRGADEGR